MEKKEYTYNLFDFMKIMEEEVKYNRSSEAIIKSVKGNIPIDYSLFGKYKSVSEIFDKELHNNNYVINIIVNLPEIIDINLNKLKRDEASKLAYNIFKRYHKYNYFLNNGNNIIVSKSGIDESIQKIYGSKNQRKNLIEYFKVFSSLGIIIEHATLVNQIKECKDRKNIIFWNYYFTKIIIDEKIYILEFDVRSMDSGENQFRVCRIQKKVDDSAGDASNTRILPTFESSTTDNNIT